MEDRFGIVRVGNLAEACVVNQDWANFQTDEPAGCAQSCHRNQAFSFGGRCNIAGNQSPQAIKTK